MENPVTKRYNHDYHKYNNVTQYNKRYILCTYILLKNFEIFALSNRRFNKLFNDTKFVKTEVDTFESTTFTK